MVDSGIPDYGNTYDSMFISWQVLSHSPPHLDHSSSKLVVWDFFPTRQCVSSSSLPGHKAPPNSRQDPGWAPHDQSPSWCCPAKLAPPPKPKRLAGLLGFQEVMAPAQRMLSWRLVACPSPNQSIQLYLQPTPPQTSSDSWLVCQQRISHSPQFLDLTLPCVGHFSRPYTSNSPYSCFVGLFLPVRPCLSTSLWVTSSINSRSTIALAVSDFIYTKSFVCTYYVPAAMTGWQVNGHLQCQMMRGYKTR